jgi:hypothetical protein
MARKKPQIDVKNVVKDIVDKKDNSANASTESSSKRKPSFEVEI